jgi:hypothetical protein
MDIVGFILSGLRVVFGFMLVLFLPGFYLSLIYYPRFRDLSIIERLVYSAVLSIASVMVLALFMEFVLGVNTTPRNLALFLCLLSFLALMVWLGERWYLKSTLKPRVDLLLSGDYRVLQNYYGRVKGSAHDRYLRHMRTGVVYHTYHQDGENHVDHSYLLDVGKEIDIQQVREFKGKLSNIELVQPPHPLTRYVELIIRENTGDGVSLVDDLEIYPVLVAKKPDIKIQKFVLKRGSTNITERIYNKDSASETQWIYSHDFHLFPFIYSEDTLDQMVDRIIAKLHEIVTSVHLGTPISSHLEVTQMLKEAFDTVIEQPESATPALIKTGKSGQPPEDQAVGELGEIPKRPEEQDQAEPEVTDRRTLQKEIMRYLNLFGITPDSFSSSKKGIEKVKIPEKSDVNKQLAGEEEEIKDLTWLFEK